jgi:hypothetical protein
MAIVRLSAKVVQTKLCYRHHPSSDIFDPYNPRLDSGDGPVSPTSPA